jgi:hypothetical protein
VSIVSITSQRDATAHFLQTFRPEKFFAVFYWMKKATHSSFSYTKLSMFEAALRHQLAMIFKKACNLLSCQVSTEYNAIILI